MMKLLAVFFGVAIFVPMAIGQNVNMERYIELTVRQGERIRLALGSFDKNTQVRVVSGTYDTTFIANKEWGDEAGENDYHYAQAGTMRIYGDVGYFNCGDNGINIMALDVSHNIDLSILACYGSPLPSLDVSKNTSLIVLCCTNNSLTSLDISNNTALQVLMCYNNNFTTQAIDDIYCALPQHQANGKAVIMPIESSKAPDYATVMATNKNIATDKNWAVMYSDRTTIPATGGTYVCGASNNGRVRK